MSVRQEQNRLFSREGIQWPTGVWKDAILPFWIPHSHHIAPFIFCSGPISRAKSGAKYHTSDLFSIILFHKCHTKTSRKVSLLMQMSLYPRRLSSTCHYTHPSCLIFSSEPTVACLQIFKEPYYLMYFSKGDNSLLDHPDLYYTIIWDALIHTKVFSLL